MKDIRLWIIVVLGIILVIMFIFWPQSESPKIARLEHEKDSLLIRIALDNENAAKLAELRKADSLKTIQTNQAHARQDKINMAVIADLRANPRVIEIIKNEPLIDSAFQAYDSALLHKDERIRELESELTSSQQLASQAELNFKATVADYEKLHANMLAQVEHYKKELRKQRRQKRAALILGVAIGVVGIIL